MLTASALFSVITVLHLTRVIQGWEVTIAAWQVPFWFSYVALIVAGVLGLQALKFAGKLK